MLAGLVTLAAALRFGTLDLQSLWFDEAFTPVHVLHPGLVDTLRAVSRRENSPPLFYIVLWAWTRIAGTSALALRTPSALAGVALVPVVWALGRELGGRRAAVLSAALIAVNPLLLWYSQEARAYGLVGLVSGLSLLFFVRANARSARGQSPTTALWAWAGCSALALLTHYFTVFWVLAQAALLVGQPKIGRRLRRQRLLAVGALGAVGGALVPLIVAQAGHGTQWIGRWALSSRLVAIPGYYLLGPSGSALGHGLLLLGGLLVLAGAALILRAAPGSRQAAASMAAVGVAGIGLPLLAALLGVDYLAPRNVVGAWVALTAALGVALAGTQLRPAGALLGAVLCAAWLALAVDVDFSPRLQRGDWSAVARVLAQRSSPWAIVTPELGAAPLEYYLAHQARPAPGSTVAVRELDIVGYPPLLGRAGRPPLRGVSLIARRSVHGLLVLRFRARRPMRVFTRTLLAARILRARTEVLVPTVLRTPAAARRSPRPRNGVPRRR